jgi:hypothetical protein
MVTTKRLSTLCDGGNWGGVRRVKFGTEICQERTGTVTGPTSCVLAGVAMWQWYLLTPCSRVLLEKLTGLQLVKKFPAFYWTRSFITAFSSAQHLCLYPEPAQSSTYPHFHFLKIHPNIILPSTPGSPQWFISLRFPYQNPMPLNLKVTFDKHNIQSTDSVCLHKYNDTN